MTFCIQELQGQHLGIDKMGAEVVNTCHNDACGCEDMGMVEPNIKHAVRMQM